MSLFSQVQIPKIPRSRKKMSHYNIMTADYGRLYPCLFIDCVPNDTFRISSEILCNTAPMITAPYTENDIRMDYFFVPYRILTSKWEDFITGGESGMDAPVLPYINPMTISNIIDNPEFGAGSLFDYFGLQDNYSTRFEDMDDKLSALPFLAYAKIWNDYYRDQNVQDEIELSSYIEGDCSSLFDQFLRTSNDSKFFLHRSWRKDYFTASLPTPQRGPDVPINFNSGFEIPVKVAQSIRNAYWNSLDDEVRPASISEGLPVYLNSGTGTYFRLNDDNKIVVVSEQEVQGGGLHVVSLDDVSSVDIPTGEMFAQLFDNFDYPNSSPLTIEGNQLPAITINDLRRANAIQVWLERNMRAGARYVEQILSHFGKRVPDYRLDRAEYLGGNIQPLKISQVLQTSESSEDSALGAYGGKGTSTGRAKAKKYRVEEHGCIIGLLSIQPKAIYKTGIPRFFRKFDKFDFYFPEFANLGEQETYTYELYPRIDENGKLVKETFGYNPRYADMQFMMNNLHGDFLKSGMRHFTQFRDFTSSPTLSREFLQIDNDSDGINRIWAVEDSGDYDHFWLTIFHHIHAKRPMPKFGTPKLIG